MSSAAQKTVLGALLVGVCALAAVPYYSSRTLQRSLTAMAERQQGQDDLLLRNLKHEAGFLHSKGTVDLVLRSRCSQDEAEQAGTTIQIEYEASHMPTPTGMNHFEWKARAIGEAANAVARVFGKDAPLSGQGLVTWQGQVQSDMKLPAVSFSQGQESLEADPSLGSITMGDKALKVNWALARAVFRGKGEAVELKQLGLNMDLSNRQKGIGQIGLKVGSLSSSLFAAEGLLIKSDTAEHGELLDSTFTQSLDHLQVANQDVKGMVLEATLKGVHAQSVETLSKILGASCGIDRLTRDEANQVRQAVKTIMVKGLSLGISKLTAQSAQGGFDAHLMLALQPSVSGDVVSLARRLTSSGELSVKGSLINPQQRALAMSTGYVNEMPDGVKAVYDYQGGLLKVSGKTLDGAAFQQALANVDERLNAWLSGKKLDLGDATPDEHEEMEAAPAEAPEAPAPAPAMEAEPAPAPAAPAAPAALPSTTQGPGAGREAACQDVDACAHASMQAAWRADIDTVRQLAARMEGLSKPELGNKAQSRKLNNQALEALKAGDAAQAVPLLQAALKENPRDVEVAGNLGYALVKAQRPQEAVAVLSNALVLDPRRTATWGPLGEALAAAGRPSEAAAALWTAWQWSSNREKTEAVFLDRAEKESATRPAVAAVYRAVHAWVTQGQRPAFKAI